MAVTIIDERSGCRCGVHITLSHRCVDKHSNEECLKHVALLFSSGKLHAFEKF